MDKPVQHAVNKAADGIQQRLTSYACGLDYDGLTPQAIDAAKARTIDTLGALIGGFFGEPCRIVRKMAAQMPDPLGATVIGTRTKTTPDMAAFANATTARYVELTDSYHRPGSFGGHPSDVVTPLLGVAEHVQASGRDFITSVVLAYEVLLRINDVFKNTAYDYTNFVCVGTAVGAGKLLGLNAEQLAHCIAMAVVPNNILAQVRTDHLSMFKAAAAGQAGRAGVFAALLARAGMEGPHLPFEGKAGWCEHVAGERFSLDELGGNGTSFRISETNIKNRASAGGAISSVLAAEKIAPLRNFKAVKQVTVEVYRVALERAGSGEQRWNPQSKEGADHSIPYVTAATLINGTITPRSYSDAQLWDPQLRALMQKIVVVEDHDYTRAYNRQPQQHRTRVSVVMDSGERLVGETGGDEDDLANEVSSTQIAEKFRGLSEDYLGSRRVNDILDRLWQLEKIKNTAAIPAALILI